MTVFDYLKAWRRRWRIVLACAVIGAALGFALSPAQAVKQGPVYQATVTMVPEPGAIQFANIYLAASLATSPDVRALAAANLSNPETAGGVSASPNPQAFSVTLTATAATAERAAEVASAYAEAISDFLRTATAETRTDAAKVADAQTKAAQKEVDTLQDRVAQRPNDQVAVKQLAAAMARYQAAYDRSASLAGGEETAPSYTVVGTAQVGLVAESSGGFAAPQTREGRAAAAGALGLALGLVIALSVDRMDTRLRKADELEEAFDLPVLAEIPTIDRKARKKRDLAMTTQPESIVAEGYRSLRSAVNFFGHIQHAVLNPRTADGFIDYSPKVIVVAGPRGGDGKTTTAANLAVALAEAGKTVVVIDCDFRNPQVQNFFGPAAPAGWTSAEQLMRPTPVRGVEVITAAHAGGDPVAMLRSLGDLVDYARLRADIVLIDSGPLLVVSEAVDLLKHADAVLVTCRVGRTTAEQANRARMLLARANVPLAGVVLLGASGPGNRASLSEPVSWSRGRKMPARVEAEAPVATYPGAAVPPLYASVPQQAQRPTEVNPNGNPATGADGGPTAQPDLWLVELSSNGYPSAGQGTGHNPPPPPPTPVIRLIDSSQAGMARNAKLNGHSDDTGAAR